jgi:Zn-dependent protease
MQVFLFVIVGWIFSVCLHEFGHAAVAYRGGDYTVKDKGYLTLNPLHYTHPVYSLVMPVVFLLMGGIGLPGGAVYIEDHLLRSRGWKAATSLAGPAMNLLLAILLCIPFWLHVVDTNFGPPLAFLIELQICAVFFNLIPVPPLDGFQTLAPWLPEDARRQAMANSNLFMWGLIIVMWQVPAANGAFWQLVHSVTDLLGIDSYQADFGYQQFQFWKH